MRRHVARLPQYAAIASEAALVDGEWTCIPVATSSGRNIPTSPSMTKRTQIYKNGNDNYKCHARQYSIYIAKLSSGTPTIYATPTIRTDRFRKISSEQSLVYLCFNPALSCHMQSINDINDDMITACEIYSRRANGPANAHKVIWGWRLNLFIWL